MAIEKNAVRKGTRWTYLRREVEVLEVSAEFVVFCELHSLAEVAPLPKFLAGAHDPSAFEHDHLLDVFGSWMPGMQPVEPEKLSQAISYILTRLGPPAPTNLTPAAPAPEPAPVVVEPLVEVPPPTVEPEERLEDYAVVLPSVPEDVAPCRPASFDKPRLRKSTWAA
ncbi:hypothetical protein [Methylorubrum aminovorans]|uniref:hypothetical protein n=1 Tax=Methylorubrum aminovorans TaxID=269069 RepID=UPI003C2E1A77